MRPQGPNLLYIHSDQHNPYVTGCYGDPLVQTPHLDSLATEGVVFENVYCPSPICVPSRMSMLSGGVKNVGQGKVHIRCTMRM